MIYVPINAKHRDPADPEYDERYDEKKFSEEAERISCEKHDEPQ